MKKLYFTIALLNLFYFCRAQTCSTICDHDLLNGDDFPFSDNWTAQQNYANPNGISDSRFHDVKYEGCVGGEDCNEQTNALIYRVFYPKGYTKDQFIECPLPCVIVAHAGQFSDCSDFNLTSGWCRNFAKLGFVAINVEYRRGTKSEGNNSNNITVQSAIALYRGIQDLRGAISSIIFRQTQEGMPGTGVDDDYRIDLNRIFLAGESAGGLAMFGAAYYNQNMMNTLLPAVSPGITLTNAFGPLNPNWYNNGGNNNMDYYRSRIKGMLIRSSGIYVPFSFASNPRDFFEVTPFIPTIFFHGQLDDVFPINSTNLNYSIGTGFNSTTFCTNNNPNGSLFKLNTNSNLDVKAYGSKGIYDNFLQNSSYPLVSAELYIDCQLGHILNPNGTVPYYTGFGIGATSRDEVIAYIVSRAAIFLALS